MDIESDPNGVNNGGGVDGNGSSSSSNSRSSNCVEAMVDIGDDLLQQFSCLGTQDKDVLIQEFQRLLPPNQLSPEGCAFFLDMNNWNLQQAICTYFDFDAPKDFGQAALPVMTFVKDITIGEGEEVPPNTRFVKTWRIQNTGPERWPIGCSLRFVAGDQMTTCERVMVDPLESGFLTDISIEMCSPGQAGIYQGQWRMCTATGQYFGEVIWVIIAVAEGGLLGLTQQMDSFHSLGSPIKQGSAANSGPVNPFASRSSSEMVVMNNGGTSSINNVDQCHSEHHNQVASLESLCYANKQLNQTRHALLRQSPSHDNEENCFHICNTVLNRTHSSSSSLSTQTATILGASPVNASGSNATTTTTTTTPIGSSDSNENHLPPTPPLSEDMML